MSQASFTLLGSSVFCIITVTLCFIMEYKPATFRPSGWGCTQTHTHTHTLSAQLPLRANYILVEKDQPTGTWTTHKTLKDWINRLRHTTDILPPTSQHSATGQTRLRLSAAQTTKTLELLPHGCMSLCASRVTVYIHVCQYKIWSD